MKKWRKNLVAGAVLVTVCAGIYANWYYGDKQSTTDLTSTLNEEKLLSSDMLVMAGTDIPITEEYDTTMSQYFASVRLSRQEARDDAVMLLQETMAYNDSEDPGDASMQLEKIVQTALSESQIESLIIAKGYSDCVAYIADEGISVAVATPEGGLEQADVAIISDVILTQTEFSMEDIRIVEVY